MKRQDKRKAKKCAKKEQPSFEVEEVKEAARVQSDDESSSESSADCNPMMRMMAKKTRQMTKRPKTHIDTVVADS